jgi:hypothetical protein
MKLLTAALVCIAALCSVAYAAKPWDGSYSALSGRYLIYSGDLGEEGAPTPTDRKAAFAIEGETAKALFESIGPDLKDACGVASGFRVRGRGDLDCAYNKDDRRSPYVCHFGIDLQTGKSMYGSIC